ncbi:MAG TPA: DUF4010 domain-containing protein [Rhodocyclaceae bacterium]|nr:DUF4010 domain-containing protein [Rhodocyclaceae bacterium]
MLHLPELPPLFVAFVATVLFGFVIGLEVHSYRRAQNKDLGFGTTRTLTLLAVLGFALAALDPSLELFAAGLVALAILLALQYYDRLKAGEQSLLPSLIALLTYPLGPLALGQPIWLLIIYVVVVLLLLSEKPHIRRFSDVFRSTETVTLAKFLIMAGLVLPVLPDRQIASFVSVSYSQLWLAVIVVSGISYLSYLAQTYFIPKGGVLLTGILGGLYSSTATTVVLSRRAHGAPSGNRLFAAAIVLATAMMYLRLMVLILILGHHAAAWHLAAPFTVLAGASALLAWLLYRRSTDLSGNVADVQEPVRHPLEFSTALLFALLFVFFAALTQFVVTGYGAGGLHLLSFAVGFSDIDPFILSLLEGKFQVSGAAIVGAIVIASGSNNLLKAAYALALGRNRSLVPAALWLTLSFVLSIAYVLLTG